MRFSPRPTVALASASLALSAALAGCSTGPQDNVSTANLRPQENMTRAEPRRYPDGSTAGGYYPNNDGTYGRPYAAAPRRYVDPGEPTPREMASYDSGRYASQNIQTGSVGGGNGQYGAAPQWQQTDRSRWADPAPVATASTGRRHEAPHAPQIVEVREGDTLYGIARRYNIPVCDLVAANRLTGERIAVGQRLVIPTRYR